ncbi:CCT domain-containing protein [Cynara cardunculus var. scolymus]|uniref:CCT domain-containing protein n=1 Tax=Cynara cardunculus var. scolymus TaxID=59895 RepID=A0A103XFY5_CYNCS|nr:CCT domain-containing protein [Cynara cardunculus var. scolymus]
MSSEIYEFDGCFFNDPFSPFNDSSSTIDILQAFQEHNYNYTPLLPSSSSSSPPLTTQENLDTPFDEIDQIATTLLSSSPPSHQLENLSLYQMGISVNSSNLEVKTEESQLPLYDNYSFYGGSDNALKMMQRSYSSNSFQQGKSSNGVLYQPKLDGFIESPNLHSQHLSSPDNCFSSTHMRRVCSTGDLQVSPLTSFTPKLATDRFILKIFYQRSPKVNQTSQRLSSSPLATETSFMEDANFKVGRYNAEERKEKILRYRAKRTQRNFNKTIKYACRKTLADNRPRIRGRFARNDEPGEIPKTTTFLRYGDDEELWMDGFHEDDDERMIGRGQIFNTYPSAGQFHQFGFIHN